MSQVLRGGQETLLCIFDAFLHDPLVDWKMATSKKPPPPAPGDDGRSAPHRSRFQQLFVSEFSAPTIFPALFYVMLFCSWGATLWGMAHAFINCIHRGGQS